MIVPGLQIPRYMYNGIKRNDRDGRMDVIVHGADSETYRGTPMTLQFLSDDTEYELCLWVGEDTATQGFIEWCDSLAPNCLHVV